MCVLKVQRGNASHNLLLKYIFTGCFAPYANKINRKRSVPVRFVGLTAAVRADPSENDVIAGKFKAAGVADVFLQPRDIIHIDIENPAASDAADVTVIVTEMIEPVGSARDFHSADFTCFGEQLQIAVDRGTAYVRMGLDDLPVNLVRGSMALRLLTVS